MNSSEHNDKREPRRSQGRARFDWPALRKAVEFHERERLCYLSAGWGRKNPSLKEWEPFQTRLPTIAEKADWFHVEHLHDGRRRG